MQLGSFPPAADDDADVDAVMRALLAEARPNADIDGQDDPTAG
ncbi:MAG: hypothetical protein ACR2QO_23785 [Acidimicrobiales bacterium]